MKIHLITVCYNSQATIKDTLASVKSQQGCDFLFTVVDGMSKDDTLNIVKEAGVASQIISEPDNGLYDALNKGVAQVADEDVLAFIHADDILAHPKVLAEATKYFLDHPQIDALYADLDYVSEDLSKVLRKWRSGKPQSFASGWMPPHPTLYVRKKAFDKVGPFRLDMGSAADHEWMLRAIHVHKISLGYLPQVTGKMRVGGRSNANLKARKSGLKYDLKAWEVNTGRKNYLAVFLKKLRKIPQWM